MYYVDSWAWIEYFQDTRAGRDAAKFIESSEPLLTTPITLFEVYHAISRTGYEAAETHFNKIISAFKAINQDLDAELVKNAARLKKEEKLAMADAFVLAAARRHGAKIITGDPDFKKFPETIFVR